jgi:hypothetical protein
MFACSSRPAQTKPASQLMQWQFGRQRVKLHQSGPHSWQQS